MNPKFLQQFELPLTWVVAVTSSCVHVGESSQASIHLNICCETWQTDTELSVYSTVGNMSTLMFIAIVAATVVTASCISCIYCWKAFVNGSDTLSLVEEDIARSYFHELPQNQFDKCDYTNKHDGGWNWTELVNSNVSFIYKKCMATCTKLKREFSVNAPNNTTTIIDVFIRGCKEQLLTKVEPMPCDGSLKNSTCDCNLPLCNNNVRYFCSMSAVFTAAFLSFQQFYV